MSDPSQLAPAEGQLADAFFQRIGDDERERLRLRAEEQAARERIAEATGIRDEALLAELAGLGIRVETLSALTLFPLVAVAWSDGEMDDAERECVLSAAIAAGIERGSTAYRLLDLWLAESPPPDLAYLWHRFTRALCQRQSADESSRLQQNLLGRAREVAASAGDARDRTPYVSTIEAACLANLAEAFEH